MLMFEDRRKNSFKFAGMMMGVVVLLNVLLFALGGSDFEGGNRKDVYLFGPFVIGGIVAMGLSCFKAWQLVPREGATAKDGSRAGARAAMLSYPLMGMIGGVVFAIGSVFAGDPTIGGAIFISVFAVFIAFLLTIWIAVPLAMLIGGLMVDADKSVKAGVPRLEAATRRPTQAIDMRQPEKKPLFSKAALTFSVGMGAGAFFVSSIVLGRLRPKANLIGELQADAARTGMWSLILICVVSAFISALIVWPLMMGSEEKRSKAVAAGGITSVLTFLVFAAVVAIDGSFFGAGSHEFHVQIMGTVIFAFFALLFAGPPAVIVGMIVGWLSAFMIPKTPQSMAL